MIFYSPYNCAQRNITRRKPNKLRSNMTRRRRIELKRTCIASPFSGRSDRVRTCGLNIPNVARSQLRYTPIVFFCFCGSGQISGQTRFGSDSNLLFPPFFTLFRRFSRLFIPEGRQRYLAPKCRANPTALHPDGFLKSYC